jgi:hypothetical protein
LIFQCNFDRKATADVERLNKGRFLAFKVLSASVIGSGYLVSFFNLRHQDQEQHINGYTNGDYNCADPTSDGLDFCISINGELDRLSELVNFS